MSLLDGYTHPPVKVILCTACRAPMGEDQGRAVRVGEVFGAYHGACPGVPDPACPQGCDCDRCVWPWSLANED